MSAAALTQLLVDITRGHRKAEFAGDLAGVLAASPLDEHLRAAIRAQDIGELWRAGAHPMALLYFARGSGWDNERYYRCLEATGVTRSGRAAGDPPAEPEPPRRRR